MHYADPTSRHDFVLIFDVKDGNPNGDPDAGNFYPERTLRRWRGSSRTCA